MGRIRNTAVVIAMIAVIIAQSNYSVANSPLGTTDLTPMGITTVSSDSVERKDSQTITTAKPALRPDEYYVTEKISVHIDGPILGPRDIEEEITKTYRYATPPPVVRHMPVYQPVPVMQFHQPAPSFYGGGFAMPSAAPAFCPGGT